MESKERFALDGEPYHDNEAFCNKKTSDKIFARNRRLEVEFTRALWEGRFPVQLPISVPDALLVRRLKATEQQGQIHLRRAAYGDKQGAWYLFLDGGLQINDPLILAGFSTCCSRSRSVLEFPYPQVSPMAIGRRRTPQTGSKSGPW